jgi:hypothetical protein
MNERIKQLVSQAEAYANQQWLEAGYPNWEDYHEVFAEDYNEKFAELIVRECAGIYDKIDNGNLHMGTDDYLEALNKTFRS